MSLLPFLRSRRYQWAANGNGDDGALAAALGDGWQSFSNISEVPAACYTVEPGALAWREGALPESAGNAAKLQVRVLQSKMQTQFRSYQRMINGSQGEPMIRTLGAPATLGSAPSLRASLQAQSVQLHEVVSLHCVQTSAMGKLTLEAGVAEHWDADRWKKCSEALGPDLWEGSDGVDHCAFAISVTAVEGDDVLILTAERGAPTVGLVGGGFGRTEELLARRRVTTIEVPPFSSEHRWTMPKPKLHRVQAVIDDFPRVAHPCISEALPTVFANSCTNVGMARVIAADVRIFGLPYAPLPSSSTVFLIPNLTVPFLTVPISSRPSPHTGVQGSSTFGARGTTRARRFLRATRSPCAATRACALPSVFRSWPCAASWTGSTRRTRGTRRCSRLCSAPSRRTSSARFTSRSAGTCTSASTRTSAARTCSCPCSSRRSVCFWS